MDQKRLNPYDRECMRLAMIKHEETFKEQVSELHRLYQIQKMLMKNIRSNRRSNIGRSQELWNLKNELGFIQNGNDAEHKPQRKQLDLEQPAEDYIAEADDGEGALELIEESEIELTLGPSNYNRWKKVPETPLTSDSGPSFSSSSTGSSQINRTSSWIHQMTRDHQLNGYELGLVKVPDMTSGYHSRSKNNIDVVEQQQQLRQERLNQSPWLFQVLSLNMT